MWKTNGRMAVRHGWRPKTEDFLSMGIINAN
jgi:hypothetical protein